MTSRQGRAIAAVAGPLAYLTCVQAGPAALGPDQREVLGVGAWMLVWWLMEPVPLAVTSLLPVIVLPLFGVVTLRDVTAPYANEMIFLFLAGFLLAAALEFWGAHLRLALRIVAAAGRNGRRIVLALMVATAVLSMWISNTATAAMMYPIAMALGQLFGEGAPADRIRTSLFLGLAYAASIGGMGTLIGTPPNLIFAAAAKELLGQPIDFARYLLIGVPCVILLVPICWALLCYVIYPSEAVLGEAAEHAVAERRTRLGKFKGGERATIVVFGLTALAWIFREPKQLGILSIPGLTSLAPGLSDAAIGLAGALALFLIPARDVTGERRRLLSWHEAKGIPWEVLLLFGGGLSLAAATEVTGLTQWFGELVTGLQGASPFIVLLAVAAGTVLLSELASNTAVAAMAMPIAAGLASGADLPAIRVMAVVALAASAGYALPIATPPNAIAYGSGRVTARQMLRAGLVMDVVAVLVIVGVVLLLGPVAG
ncbi:MAG: anion transporter [Gemmatimonadetes bacterium]|nr:anion transporter [Gemmatimonadota bacterium]